MKIKPKKSLGQNFLIDQNIINLIINSVSIKKNDILLEVGPGTGNLTEKIILKKPKKIIVVEKDKDLVKKLLEKFNNKIEIINDDILKINEEKLFESKITVFGNLPYNISTQILAKWIKLKNLNFIFKKLILMFQKEVADRILASTGEKQYGRLSILSAWKMNVTKIKEVSPNSFYPSPKIKSTILLFEPKKKFFNIKNPKNLEFVTNSFFGQKRKMIKKPLKAIFNNIDKLSNKLKIDITEGPQNLPPNIYFQICKEYEDLFF